MSELNGRIKMLAFKKTCYLNFKSSPQNRLRICNFKEKTGIRKPLSMATEKRKEKGEQAAESNQKQ